MANVIGQSIVEGRSSGVTLGNGHPKKADFLDAVNPVVGDQLREVEATIDSELRSGHREIEILLEHSRKLGGKRLRPALVLLTAKALGNINQNHVIAAAALEMVHLATLIHDDVLDNATTRRHHKTAHAKFGTKSGVLLGDFLFTHSFSLAAKTQSIGTVEILSSASNLVCEGEIKQNAWQGDFSISEDSYLQMVGEKTGELCAAGCGIGAILAGASKTLVEDFRTFGQDLGVAFQIIDDVLDLIGNSETVGKTLGTDLRNRKVTLPVIHALKSLEGDGRAVLLDMLTWDSVSVADVVPVLNRCGSIDYARQVAKTIAGRAVAFAEDLQSSDASNALLHIGNMILDRTH